MSAKIDLKFLDRDGLGDYIQVEEDDNSIYIEGKSFGNGFVIGLDKSTAIKFAKTLRTEINKIQD